jgi:hypothetical protein
VREVSFRMRIEKELISYLQTYGNTKETDLIEYGTKCLNLSAEKMRKTLDNMLLEGWIQKTIHDKLGVNRIYIVKGVWADFYSDIEAESLDLKNKENLKEDSKNILVEAEVIAKEKAAKEKMGR